eukprot:897214-Pleurochrysis_carterae.AAC.1
MPAPAALPSRGPPPPPSDVRCRTSPSTAHALAAPPVAASRVTPLCTRACSARFLATHRTVSPSSAPFAAIPRRAGAQQRRAERAGLGAGLPFAQRRRCQQLLLLRRKRLHPPPQQLQLRVQMRVLVVRLALPPRPR